MKKVKRFFKKIKEKLKRLTKKQWIIIGGVLLVIIIALVVGLTIKDNKQEDLAIKDKKVVINNSEGIIKETTYNDLTINNIILLSKGDYSTFTATVTNNSKEDKNIEDFDIVLKNGDREVVTLYAYLGETLKKGESREITASIGMRLPKSVVDTAVYQDHK